MRRAILALSLIAASGCSANTQQFPALPHVPRPASSPAEGELRVGTARVDVTPAPGPSTFGHGPDAHATNGYWSRLYCRVFVLETDPGYPLALVPCDLAAISFVLHRSVNELVAKRLAEKNWPVRLSPDRLMLSATHTHHGPAHYFEGPAYGGLTSTRLPGYDPDMLAWLAQRIANGIVDAIQAMRPAQARWVHDELWGLTRNRSLHAHRTNDLQVAAPPAGAELTESQKAVDPSLHVLQLEELSPDRSRVVAPLGWLTWFAMHPTVMPAPTRMFHADAFGVASREVERRLNQRRAELHAQGEALAGIINTNEGDISPAWIEGTTDEAIRIGERLASGIWKTNSSAEPWRPRLRVDSRYAEQDLPGAYLHDGKQLCDRAMLGASSVHGATDHPCTLDRLLEEEADYDPKARDNKFLEYVRCQAPKRRMMGSLQSVLISPEGFPTHVPLALVRIDDTFLAHVPAELTIAAGNMVRKAVRRQIPYVEGSRKSRAIVAGLANGYIQYVTTEAEYHVQTYEGGSNLYGPKTAAYLADRFESLANMMRPDLDERHRPRVTTPLVPEFHAHFAPERSRLASAKGELELERVPGRGTGTTVCTLIADPPTLCMKWIDGAPGRVRMHGDRPWIRLEREGGAPVRVSMPANPPNHWYATAEPSGFLDDRGVGFQTHVRESSGGAWTWTTVWRPTRQEWAEAVRDGKVKLMVDELASPAFGTDILGERCSADVAAECMAD